MGWVERVSAANADFVARWETKSELTVDMTVNTDLVLQRSSRSVFAV
jgi:hypothetical protein